MRTEISGEEPIYKQQLNMRANLVSTKRLLGVRPRARKNYCVHYHTMKQAYGYIGNYDFTAHKKDVMPEV